MRAARGVLPLPQMSMHEAVLHLKTRDPLLAEVIERVGPYAIEYRDADFSTLAQSIVCQQLSGKAAATIYGRLEQAAGGAGVTPEGVLRLRPARMRALGLSRQKTEYIRDLARRTRAGEIDFAAFPALSDDAIIEALTAVKGVGVWTVQMFLIFALGRPDVLPTGDLGVRAAVRKLYGLAELPKPTELVELGAKWRPYCSVASWYLWRSLGTQAAL
jgi:DNA-3-methyladenine glycosylase II